MKRYTSGYFKSAAWFYLAFPVVYLAVVAVIFDVPAGALTAIVLSRFYWIVAILAMITGYGLLEVRRWSWYLLLPVDLLILCESAFTLNDYGEAHHKVLAFLAVAITIGVIAYRVGKEIRVPYFFPKIAWWESDPRYRISVPVKIFGGKKPRTPPKTAEPEATGEILDISLGGCFVKSRVELPEDHRVFLEFHVFGFQLECEGVIVWRTQSTVTHPRGIGVKFRGLDRAQRRQLRAVTRRLRRATLMARKERYLINQESFMKKLGEEPEAAGAEPKASSGSYTGSRS